MLWVLFWIASIFEAVQMSTRNICFYKLVEVILMSSDNIYFYNENQNTYLISIIKYVLLQILCSYFFKTCPY